MKNRLIALAGILLLALAFSTGPAGAEVPWWKKGLDILNELSKEGPARALGEPTTDEMGKAFKEALRIGSENVIKRLGKTDGFNADSVIHIPLPEKLNTVKSALSKVGMSQAVDNLELKLNRAAEYATPRAKKLFLKSISEMTFEDVKGIYKGPENSATEYFRKKMTPSLKEEMRPVIENSLSEVGAIQAYDRAIGRYRAIPFVPDVKADLTEHVMGKGLEGIFYYIGKEEADIRKNPLRHTTELLKKVFGKAK